MNVTVKMPPPMKKALEKLAEKEFTSISGLLKKAAEKILQEHGIDWREQPEEDQPTSPPSRPRRTKPST